MMPVRALRLEDRAPGLLGVAQDGGDEIPELGLLGRLRPALLRGDGPAAAPGQDHGRIDPEKECDQDQHDRADAADTRGPPAAPGREDDAAGSAGSSAAAAVDDVRASAQVFPAHRFTSFQNPFV
jgi:hypothetical protein